MDPGQDQGEVVNRTEQLDALRSDLPARRLLFKEDVVELTAEEAEAAVRHSRADSRGTACCSLITLIF